ncbi:MFS transporter [Myriangium duriaei CBS 260.36]|uniref:MFS transporter n=1 Tax=Myriangium duriaei CBS 260.36 TaxID=1168546 RepID=A0A9P4ITA5_9PEZI|nr:MFS transporter [Myriangium duriaei CBS 260.36]
MASIDEKHDEKAGASAFEADEAYVFLSTHPNAEEILAEGHAILNDPKSYARLLRKIDFTICPLLACVYFLQFLDKTTLSYTAIMGLRTDTHLKGQDYSNLSMLFYIGFLATEFPTQYLAQRISKYSFYLSINIMLWGAILMCHAACTNFAGLAICRTLLGVFEAPVAPILVLIISMWYRKIEQGRRISCFYVMNSLTQIIGGAIAYAASFATGHFASWRIFFLVIGALTIVIGAVVGLLLPDSPVKAKRFSDAEKVAALLRTRDNQSGTQNQTLKKAQVLETLKDVRVWLVALCTMLSSIPNGGISNFSSILLTTFGYTPRFSLIMSMPAGAVGVVTVLICGWLSDRFRDRTSIMLVCITPTILAAALMIGFDPKGKPHNRAGLLGASFLTGTFGAAFMLLLAYNASNISGHTKKVTTNALTMVAFAVGNILGTQTFQASQAPGYVGGKASIIACLTLLIPVVFVLRYCNHRLNVRNKKILAEMSDEEREMKKEEWAWRDDSDKNNPFFVYTR